MSDRRPVLHVGGGASPYDVVVGHDVLDELPAMLGPDVRRVALCHPDGLADLADRVVAHLAEDVEVLHLPLPDGEAAKTAAVALEAWERWATPASPAPTPSSPSAAARPPTWAASSPRPGCAASSVVHVPTTLLAMVDAAVGGKTGMNTGAGKNLVGTFHEPAGVLCDLDVLGSLPRAELVAGLAEVVKCGFIADPRDPRVVEADPAAALDPGVARAARAGRAGGPRQGRRGRRRPPRDRRSRRPPRPRGRSTTATRWPTRSRGAPATPSGTARRSPSAWSTSPSWPGSPAGSTTPPPPGTRRCSSPSACRRGSASVPFEDLLATMRVDKKSRGVAAAVRRARRAGQAGGPGRSRRGDAAGGVPPPEGGDHVKVLVLNGPNLGRLGRRQPEIYGTTTHAELVDLCEEWGRELGLEVEVRQTNHEGELLDWLNQAADETDPGGAQRRRVDALLARAARRLRPADGAAGRGAHQRPEVAARGVSGTTPWSRVRRGPRDRRAGARRLPAGAGVPRGSVTPPSGPTAVVEGCVGEGLSLS